MKRFPHGPHAQPASAAGAAAAALAATRARYSSSESGCVACATPCAMRFGFAHAACGELALFLRRRKRLAYGQLGDFALEVVAVQVRLVVRPLRVRCAPEPRFSAAVRCHAAPRCLAKSTLCARAAQSRGAPRAASPVAQTHRWQTSSDMRCTSCQCAPDRSCFVALCPLSWPCTKSTQFEKVGEELARFFIFEFFFCFFAFCCLHLHFDFLI